MSTHPHLIRPSLWDRRHYGLLPTALPPCLVLRTCHVSCGRGNALIHTFDLFRLAAPLTATPCSGTLLAAVTKWLVRLEAMQAVHRCIPTTVWVHSYICLSIYIRALSFPLPSLLLVRVRREPRTWRKYCRPLAYAEKADASRTTGGGCGGLLWLGCAWLREISMRSLRKSGGGGSLCYDDRYCSIPSDPLLACERSSGSCLRPVRCSCHSPVWKGENGRGDFVVR